MRKSTNYTRFAAGRAKTVAFQVTELLGSPATETPKDCSASNIAAHLRAWTAPAGDDDAALVMDVTLTKTVNPDGTDPGPTSNGATGWFTGTAEFGAAHGQVFLEVVVIDTSSARDGNGSPPADYVSVSGYREERWGDEWAAEVVAAPIGG